MKNKRAFQKSILDTEEIRRYFKLRVLNNFVRPARRVENASVLGFTEHQFDQSLASFFRRILRAGEITSQTAPTQYGMLHYYDSAPGSREPPIVMIHGLGSNGQCFALLAGMFKNKRRVVMPDLFHFSGFSRANNAVMDINEHANSIAELIEQLNVGPVDLCGLSLGGWVSLRIAAQRPDLVTTMTLLNPAGLRFSSHTLRDSLLYLSWNKFHSVYPGIFATAPYSGVPFLSSIIKRSVFRVLKDDGVRDFVKTVRSEHFVDEQLSSISARVLLLWGNADRFLSSEIPVALAAGIPNCTTYIIDNCAHILCMEAPVNVYELMGRLLGIESQPDNVFARWILRYYKRFSVQNIETRNH